MDSTLYDQIFRRKSFHTFKGITEEPLTKEELTNIYTTYEKLTPLNPSIRTAIKIVPSNKTTCRRGQEYCILLFSEMKEGYLQNIGYIGEQLDLYLVSKNIGTLWFGIGKTDEKIEGMEFVIMIAIRKIPDLSKFRKNMFKSKRKPVEEIWQGEHVQGVTDIVRFTPSACNTQPWLVKNDESITVYRYKKPGKRGIMPADKVTYYNKIDIGIFMYFFELCMEHEKIQFERALYKDNEEKEFAVNAIYRIKN